jgi:hypothetical protein
MPAELDLRRLLAVLDRHGVSYVLIGGLAAVYHGSPFPSDLKARIRTESAPKGLRFAHDAASLAAASTWNLTTVAGDLDISFTPDGTSGYGDLVREAESAALYGSVVRVASLADVIRSKQAANRPKDQRVLPTLRRILSQRSR